jgi:hypothetical protein
MEKKMGKPEAKAPEADIEEEQLSQAIEDLRGALHEAPGEGEKAASLSTSWSTARRSPAARSPCSTTTRRASA